MDTLQLLESPLIIIIIVILASWRLSLMIVAEDGAFSVTYAIRLLGYKVQSPVGMTRFGAWKNNLKPAKSDGWVQVHLIGSNHFGKLITCIMCTSIWIALFGLLGLHFYHIWYVAFFYQVLALSGAIIIVNRQGLK